MGTYTIGEMAERSGFSASALRYYESIGLVGPTGRTDAGYRVYDDEALARLAFVARAKQLGCSLEEITDLVRLWDGEGCGPVQGRLHQLVTANIDAAQRQVGELTAFVAQLRTVAGRLDQPAADGPCGEGCACLAEPATNEIACTLDAEAVPGRVTEWQRLLAKATSRTTTDDGGLRVELDDVALGDLAGLVAAEQRCCAFFSFAITVDHRGVALEVRAPDGAADVVEALFGQT